MTDRSIQDESEFHSSNLQRGWESIDSGTKTMTHRASISFAVFDENKSPICKCLTWPCRLATLYREASKLVKHEWTEE